MQQLANYQTLLQLSVGLNLVVGAYNAHRKDVEDRIKSRLDSYREQMDQILVNGPQTTSAIPQGLDGRPVKDLDDRELRRCLADCTIRFYRRREAFARRDGWIEPLLYPIGFLAVILLLYASLWPKTEVRYALVCPIAIILIGPALCALARLGFETKQHERFYRGSSSRSFQGRIRAAHDERIKTTERLGEIVKVTNAVRLRRDRLLQEIRSAKSKQKTTTNNAGAKPAAPSEARPGDRVN